MSLPSSSLTNTPSAAMARESQRFAQHYQQQGSYNSVLRRTPPSASLLDDRHAKAEMFTPPPLVLDPNQRNNTYHDHQDQRPHSSHDRRTPGGPKSSLVGKLFKSSTNSNAWTSPGMVNTPYQPRSSMLRPQMSLQEAKDNESSLVVGYTASSLAQDAPHAGFLCKLGSNIPEFKRRFFVLQQRTELTYYVSPNDVKPRGRVLLEGCQVVPQEELPDGRFRFAVQFVEEDKQVVLEARNRDLGEAWMRHLNEEQLQVQKDKVKRMETNLANKEREIERLKAQLDDFRLVERDRDGALEDARNWKWNFERLDEALRLLTQQLQKSPEEEQNNVEMSQETAKMGNHEDSMHLEEKKDDGDGARTENNITGDKKANEAVSSIATVESDDKPDSPRNMSQDALLDHTAAEDRGEISDLFAVPGTYFSGLSNACQQLRESLRLASIEASTAVEDLQQSNEKRFAVEKRMAKAEKQLVKLWEENCAIRKENSSVKDSLKQKKREKRVLVREVKALQEVAAELEREASDKHYTGTLGDEAMADSLLGSDDERLINEIENHVNTSIQIHEQLFGVSKKSFQPPAVAVAESLDTSIDYSEPELAGAVQQRSSSVGIARVSESSRVSPLKPKLLSLLDDSDQDDESDTVQNHHEDDESLPQSYISSVGAEMGDGEEQNAGLIEIDIPRIVSASNSPELPNPLLELGNDDKETPSVEVMKNVRSVKDTGQATSRLVCPLEDVVDGKGGTRSEEQNKSELEIYHLTFYSSKIGIQFQKAPPAPLKPKGLLTDALAADFGGPQTPAPAATGEEHKDLESVAAIAGWAKRNRESSGGSIGSDAHPRDIVLVCGFEGFDVGGSNLRPKLGARLVAFDGISVEKGPWTFEGIRQAIKARGRPLTLSFRNDYLTTDQRIILTKAVGDMQGTENHAKNPEPRPVISSVPSLASVQSHESDSFVNGGIWRGKNGIGHQPDLDVSAYVTKESTCSRWRRRASSGSSVNSASNHSRQSNFRSFSEAGSSVISNSVAPLLANLMKKVPERKEPYTPDYLKRKNDSLENTPQHKDFQANLL